MFRTLIDRLLSRDRVNSRRQRSRGDRRAALLHALRMRTSAEVATWTSAFRNIVKHEQRRRSASFQSNLVPALQLEALEDRRMLATIVVNPGVGTPLQDAVNASAVGDTIQINAGTYPESVDVSGGAGSLSFIGVGTPVITSTTGPAFFNSSNETADFTFDGLELHSNGVNPEDGIRLSGVTGTVQILNNLLNGIDDAQIFIIGTGTSSTNVLISGNTSTNGSVAPTDFVKIDSFNSSTINATIASNSVNISVQPIEISPEDTSTVTVNILNNPALNTTGSAAAVDVAVSGAFTPQVNVTIAGNMISSAGGDGVRLQMAGNAGASMIAVVDGNTFTNIGSGTGDDGITLQSASGGAGTVDASIKNNTFGTSGDIYGSAIALNGLTGAATFNLVITGNNIDRADPVAAGSAVLLNADGTTVNLDMRSNTVAATFARQGFQLDGSGGGAINVEDFNADGSVGPPANTAQGEITDNNTYNGGGTAYTQSGTVNYTVGDDTVVNEADIPVLLGDFVWDDNGAGGGVAGDGIQNGTEPGVAGVQVDLSGTATGTTFTDANGEYLFSVVPGAYTVTVIPPSGMAFTLQNQGGDDTIDSDVDPNTGAAGVTIMAGMDNLTIDAGLVPAPTGAVVAAIVSGDLVLDESGGDTDDQLTISFDGTDYTIMLASGVFSAPGLAGDGTGTLTVPAADITASDIIFNTLGGDDTLIVDYGTGAGSGLFNDDIIFNGGLQTASDLVRVTGNAGAATDVTYDTGAAGPDGNTGTVTYAGTTTRTITFTGLEPFEDLSIAASLTVNDVTGVDVMNFVAGPLSAGIDPLTLAPALTYQLNFGGPVPELINFRNKGTFTVNGLGGADVITMDQPTQLGDSLATVNLNGGAGMDTINVRSTPTGVTTTVNGGDNTDTINIGSTANSLSTIDGNVNVNGDGHDVGNTMLTIKGDTNTLPAGDLLNFNDQGDAGGFTYALGATTFTRDGGMAGTVTYLTIETLNLNAAAGMATVNVTNTAAAVNTTITTQDMADMVNVTDTGVDSNVVINTAGGGDSVTISDTGIDGGDANAFGSFTQVNAGDGMDMLTLAGNGVASRVELNGQGGTDTINVQATAAMSVTNVNGGDNSDTINIGSTSNSLSTIDGDVCVNGDGHDVGDTLLTIKGDTNTLPAGDLLNFNDQGDAGGFTYALGATTFTRDGGMAGTVTYLTIETLNLNAAMGPEVVNVTNTAAAVNTTITMQDMVDDINVTDTGTDSNVVINTAGGADTVDISDTGIDGGDANAFGSFTQVNAGDGMDMLTLAGNGVASRVELNGQGGTDTINVQATAAMSVTNVNGGDNSDTINIGSTSNSLSTIDGDVCVNGDGHDVGDTLLTIKGDTNTLPAGDLLNFNDQGDAGGFTYALGATTFTRDGGMAGTVTYLTIETLNLNAAMGPEVVNVTNTAAAVNTTITMQDMVDDINVTDTGTDSNVVINTAGGADTVDISDTGIDGGDANAFGSFTQVNAGDGMDMLTLAGNGVASRVELNGQGGTDTINVQATAAMSVTNVNGGDNSDTINIGSTSNSLSTIDGDVCVNGDGHDVGDTLLTIKGDTNTLPAGDLLNFNDQGDAGGFTYALGATTFTRDGGMAGTVTYLTIETLNLNAAMGPEVVNVTNTAAAVNTTITMQDMVDDINVTDTGTDSNVVINTAGGADTVDIADTGGIGAPDAGLAGAGSFTQVNAGDGNDVLTLAGSNLASRVELNGQAGNDVITLGSPANVISGILGMLQVNGGSHLAAPTMTESVTAKGNTVARTLPVGDTLNINDQAYAAAAQYNLTDMMFDRDTTVAQTMYATIETINLNAGTLANDINIISTPANSKTTVTSQDAADDIDVTTTGSGSILIVNAAGGADAVDIATTGSASVTIINGGDAGDALTQVTSGTGSGVALNGQGGADTITIQNSGATSATLATGGSEADLIEIQNAGANSRVQADGDANDDIIKLRALPVTAQAQLNGGDGKDAISLGSTDDATSVISNILGMVMVDGGTHPALPTMSESVTAKGLTVTATVPMGDTLTINDQGYAAAAQYNLADGTFNRDTTVAPTMFTSIETINLNAGAAANDINVADTPDSSKTTINSQDAADDIDITLTGDNSILIVNAKGGADAVDIATTGSASVTIVNGGNGTDTLTQVTSGAGSGVALNGNGNEDMITIQNSGATSATLATGGTQNDLIEIQNAGANSRVQADGDANDDIIKLRALPVTAQAQLNGGDGKDAISLGSTDDATSVISNILGMVMVDGGTHPALPTMSESVTAKTLTVTATVPMGDTLTINDQGYAAAAQYNLADGTFNRDTTVAPTMFTDIETINLNAGAAANDINVADTPDSSKTTITSQDAADDIDITLTGDNSILIVNAKGGADAVDIATTGSASVTIINGGNGTDALTQVTSGAGSGVALNGNGNEDMITIQNSGATSATLATGGTQNDLIEIQNAGANSRVQADGDANDDIIKLRALPVTAQAQLNGGDGKDAIRLGSTDDATSVISNILGMVMVDGGTHPALPTMSESVTAKGLTVTATVPMGDTLTINDQGYAAAAQYNLADGTFNRDTTVAPTMFTDIETINLNAGSAANDINVTDTPDSSKTTITSQDAADDIDITLTGTSSILIVNAAGGADAVDIATTGAMSVTIINGGDAGDALTQVTSGAGSGVALNGQGGADTITIQNSGATSATLATGGTQNDLIEIQNAGANSRVQADGDANDDIIKLRALPVTAQAQLNGGDGKDAISLGSTDDATSVISNILGMVMVDGGTHPALPTMSESVTAKTLTVTATVPMGDTLNINDQGYAAAAQYNLADGTFNRDTTVAPTMFTDIETINLNAGAAANDINVADTPDSSKTTINSQDAADDIDITLTGDNSILIVNAKGGADAVDIATTGSASVTIVNGGNGTDTLTQVTSGAGSGVALNGNGNEDMITIQNSGATSATLATGGTQNDLIEIQNAGANSRVQADGDANDDIIKLRALPVTAQAQLNGGDGKDAISLGSTDDATSVISNILGMVMVDGGTHPALPTMSESVTAKGLTVTATVPMGDTLTINDQGYAAAAQYNLADGTFNRDTTVAPTMFTDIETINLNAGAAANDINVADTPDSSKTTITSQDAADDIDITLTGDNSILIVNAKGGADAVDIATTGSASVTIINGGNGTDALTQVTSGAGSGVALNGNGNEDMITIQNSGATSATLATGGTQNDLIEIQNAGANSRVQADGDANDDIIKLRALPVTAQAQLNGGDGKDAIRLGSTDDATSVISNILGMVMVDGGTHPALPTMSESVTAKGLTVTATVPMGDTLTINDQGYAAAAQYNLADGTFNRDTTVAPTMFTDIETINLNAGAAANDINVADTPDSSKTTINSQDAADDIDITLTGDNSILIVNAAGGADAVDIATTGSASVTIVNGGNGRDMLTQVTSGVGSGVALNGNGNEDTITIQNTGATSATLVTGGTQNDVINVEGTATGSFTDVFAGPGSDIINIGNTSNSLSDIDGDVCVNGEAHAAGANTSLTIDTETNTLPTGDVLNFNDQGDAGGFNYSLDATTFTRDGGMAGTVTYLTIETLNLNTTMGMAVVNVTDTADAVNTTITTQDMADTINVTDTGTDSNVVINTAGGADTIEIADTGIIGAPDAGLAGAGSFTQVNAGAGADMLTLAGNGSNSRVELNGEAGDDVLNVRSTAVGSRTFVNGNAGNDTINVSSDAPTNAGNLNGIAGALEVDGGTNGPETRTIISNATAGFSTTLLGGITAAATTVTIPLISIPSLPAATPFQINIEGEDMLVNSVTTNAASIDLMVTRGAGAVAHANNAPVVLEVFTHVTTGSCVAAPVFIKQEATIEVGDALNVSDAGEAVAHAYGIDNDNVVRAGGPSLDYMNIAAVNLFAGSAIDVASVIMPTAPFTAANPALPSVVSFDGGSPTVIPGPPATNQADMFKIFGTDGADKIIVGNKATDPAVRSPFEINEVEFVKLRGGVASPGLPNSDTGFDDLVNMTGARGLLEGFAGNDILFGGSDIDVIAAGAGADYLVGNDGDDYLFADVDLANTNPVTGVERTPDPAGLGDLLDGGNGINTGFQKGDLDVAANISGALFDGGACKNVITWLQAQIVGGGGANSGEVLNDLITEALDALQFDWGLQTVGSSSPAAGEGEASVVDEIFAGQLDDIVPPFLN